VDGEGEILTFGQRLSSGEVGGLGSERAEDQSLVV
jgi:hypothetical protein